MRLHTLTCIALFLCTAAFGQNLVINPSFELSNKNDTSAVDTCDYFQRCRVTGWYVPANCIMTSDFFAPGVSRGSTVAKRFPGKVQAHSGKCFIGLYTAYDWKEYLCGTLSTPMEAGKNYRITFWIALSSQSDIALYNLDVLFNKDSVPHNGYKRAINGLQILGTERAKNSEEWMQVAADYTAIGGEKYFTIGYRDKSLRSKSVRERKTTGDLPFAYYFFDDFSISRFDGPKLPVPIPLPKLPVTRILYFDVDKYELKAESKTILDTVISVMKTRPKINITFDGHTDSTGDLTKNIKLSEERSKAAAQYLIAHGIDPKRIITRGYADMKEVSDETRLNRRVEFFFTQ